MHVGMWSLAAIVIVIASWLMYHYLAPANWKEWTRAGVLQAFIIAFYAEMYGFPLTIYFLARFLGLDLAWTKGGNLWGAALRDAGGRTSLPWCSATPSCSMEQRWSPMAGAGSIAPGAKKSS